MEGYFIAAIVVLRADLVTSRGLEMTPRNCPSASTKNVDLTCRPRTSIGLVLRTENGGAAAGSVIFTTDWPWIATVSGRRIKKEPCNTKGNLLAHPHPLHPPSKPARRPSIHPLERPPSDDPPLPKLARLIFIGAEGTFFSLRSPSLFLKLNLKHVRARE